MRARAVPVGSVVLLSAALLVAPSVSATSAPPAVTRVSASSGRTSGGGTVTVTGRGFTHVSAVVFGTTRATGVRVRSSTRLTVTAPRHLVGVVDVRVRTDHGTSATGRADRYTFVGRLSVLAGRVGGQDAPTSGRATASDVKYPWGVAVDSKLDVFVANTGYGVIEKVTPKGVVSVVAGTTGEFGTPTPGLATRSHLVHPEGLAVDAKGNLFIADDGGSVVEKVTPGGVLSIAAGTGTQGQPSPGPATSSDLDDAGAVATDRAGNLYIADAGNDVVEKVTPAGDLSIVAGDGVRGLNLFRPNGVALDAKGDLYIAEDDANVVDELPPTGRLSVVAGGGTHEPTTGAQKATGVRLDHASGLAVGADGAVYLADGGSATSPGWIDKVTPAGSLSIVAGRPGDSGVPRPGPATSSRFHGLRGVAVDAGGALYGGDFYNDVVEKVA